MRIVSILTTIALIYLVYVVGWVEGVMFAQRRERSGSGEDGVEFKTDGSSSFLHLPLEANPVRFTAGETRKGFPQIVKLFDRSDDLHSLEEFSLKMHNATLGGGITVMGEYFTRIQIGDQEFRVQVDTGSSTLAIPLAQCMSCLAGDFRYAVDKSPSGLARPISCESSLCGENTCHARCEKCSGGKCCAQDDPTKCGFYLLYGDGSGAQGALMYDEMEWGGVKVKGIFGGVLRDSADFEQKGVDGILGLAYPSLGCTPTCSQPIFDLMVDQANIPDIFGICLYPTGGSITLGGYDRRSMKSKMMWAPMVQRYPPTFYTVPLPGSLNINGSEVSIPRFRSAIVDSGTTLIVMAQVSFNAIVQHLKMNYCNVPGLCASNSWFQPAACVNIGQKDLNKLPTLTFDVGNDVGLELRPEDYMLAYMVAGQQYRCVGIAAIDNISEVDVILGNTLNMRYVTIYDRENKRMGFAERRANCGALVDQCEMIETCEQCATNPDCKYNYLQGQCITANIAQKSSFQIPYPICSGSMCFCEFGFSRWIYNIVVGIAMGLVIACVVLLLGRFAYDRRNRGGYQEITE